MLIVLIRAFILYVLVTFSLRLMGKRQLGELQPSELVTTILISNIASLPIEDTDIPIILGAIPVLTIVGFELIISNISLYSKKFRQFISGRPVVIISNGEIDQKQLKRLRFSIDDLMESLRQANVFDVREVCYAIVETTGKVSVLQKFESQPVTPEMLELHGTQNDPPTIVVSNGKIVESALRACSVTKQWVFSKIENEGYKLGQVFIMTVDSQKQHYIIKKER